MQMNYFVLGTNNLDNAIQFYEVLFEQSGITRVFSNERMTFWQGGGFTFALALPFDETPATNGNGTMVGFKVESIERVQKLHQKVIGLGGTCEGEPGLRGPMYSAYVRDRDLNKLSFYFDTSDQPKN
nr:VOC family protein [Hyphomonas sp. Mor2]